MTARTPQWSVPGTRMIRASSTAAPAKPALSVRAPAVATAAARLSLVVSRLAVSRPWGDGGWVKAGEVTRAFAVLPELLRKTMGFPAFIVNL